MTPDELKNRILQKYPGLPAEAASCDLTFILPPPQYTPFCTYVKEDPELLFDNLMCLTAVDNVKDLQLVVHLSSYARQHRLALKIPLDRENPKIPTLTALWPGADWHERETYDLYGVVFEGHPDLRRILLPDDWEGYPMRKGYTHWNLTPLPDDVTEVTKDYPVVPNPIR